MPHVLHVTPYMAAEAGGPPVVVDRLAVRAPDNGWSAEVVTTPMLTRDQGAALRMDANTRYALSTTRSQFSALAGADRAHLAAAIRRSDIVHIHTLWSPLCWAAAQHCWENSTPPYIVAPHGMLDPYSLSVKPLKKRAYWWLFERHIATRAAAYLFTTQEERDLATSQVGTLPDPSVVSLGADAPHATRAELTKNFFSRHPELTSQKLLVFLGRLHPKKGLEHALGALAHIKRRRRDVTLIVIGAGNRDYEAHLRRHLERLGLASSVRFLGMQTGAAKWQALAAAHAFVLPSYQENFGIAVAEALHTATPVLVSTKVNIGPEIAAAGAGFIHRLETAEEDIARQVVNLLEDNALWQSTSDRALQLARDRYTWDTCARGTYALYTRMLEAAGRSKPKAFAIKT